MALDRDVEAGRRLVEDQQRWRAGERERDLHALCGPAESSCGYCFSRRTGSET